MRAKLLSIVSAVALTACVGTEVTTTVPFDPNEVAFINQSGSNTINGEAFLRQRGGGVVTCAGSEVELLPAGGYARQRMSQIYGSEQGGYVYSGNILTGDEADPQYLLMTRKTTCDSQGNFRFSGVANGDYFVLACVEWQVQAYTSEGGCMMRKVSARGGSQELIMTQ